MIIKEKTGALPRDSSQWRMELLRRNLFFLKFLNLKKKTGGIVFLLFVRKEVFRGWAKSKSIRGICFVLFSKRFGVRERETVAGNLLNRDKIKKKKKNNTKRGYFLGNTIRLERKGKKKQKDFERELEDIPAETKTKEEKDK